MGATRKAPAAMLEAKETLTAVLLADSFTQKLRPITVERPKVLLPLVNAPMLDYTLHWLAANDVDEVFVFCCAHAEQIEQHLQESGWGKKKKIKVHAIVSTNCISVGEALRLLDQRDLVKGDFVLVSGDVVSNMDLRPALEVHRSRRAADKNAIMTMVMRGGISEGQRRWVGDSPLTLIMDADTKRVLKFEEYEVGRKRRPYLSIDPHLLSERDAVCVRTDLIDSHIYICAPEVLMLFSDNFDYQNIHRDFVPGVLSEEELGNKLFMYELGKEYAARVHNLRSYAAVSRDVLARWAYPFVPDTNLTTSNDASSWYTYNRGRIYMDMSVSVSRTAAITRDTCIGGGSSVGNGAVIEDCVIGRNCRIGNRVTMRGCYLCDNVTVEDGAVLDSALLCDGVVVRAQAVVQEGCVLSYRVVIDRQHTVPAHSRISLCQQLVHQATLSEDELEYASTPVARPLDSGSDDSDDEERRVVGEKPLPHILRAAEALSTGGIPEQAVAFDTEHVGTMGAGFLWKVTDADEWRHHSLTPPPPPLALEEEVLELMETAALTEEPSNAESVEDGPAAPTEPHFKTEVAETYLRCVKEHISHDNVVIELNGLKIAEDKTFADCARYMFTTMLGLCLPAPPTVQKMYRSLYISSDVDAASKEGRIELLRRAIERLTTWQDLLHKFLKSDDDQVELLLTLEEFCGEEGDYEGTGERGAAFSDIFPQLLHKLYDLDIISEEAVLKWAAEKEHAEEDEKIYLRKAQPFLQWLREADEESDDEESDEEDE